MAASPSRRSGKRASEAVEDVEDVEDAGSPPSRDMELGSSRRGPLRSFSGVFTFFAMTFVLSCEGHIV